jgi:hypothetical protein
MRRSWQLRYKAAQDQKSSVPIFVGIDKEILKKDSPKAALVELLLQAQRVTCDCRTFNLLSFIFTIFK